MGPSASPGGERSRGAETPLPRSWRDDAFRLDVEEGDRTLYLRLKGEFDRACVARVETALDRVCAEHTRQVVFDLQGLSFLDLAGLKTILKTHERARAEPFEVVVVRPKGFLNRIFTLTRVGERLKMVDDVSPPEGAG